MIHWFSPQYIKSRLLRGSKGLATFDLEEVSLPVMRSRSDLLLNTVFSVETKKETKTERNENTFSIEVHLEDDNGDVFSEDEGNISGVKEKQLIKEGLEEILKKMEKHFKFSYTTSNYDMIYIHPFHRITDVGLPLNWSGDSVWTYRFPLNDEIDMVAFFDFDPT